MFHTEKYRAKSSHRVTGNAATTWSRNGAVVAIDIRNHITIYEVLPISRHRRVRVETTEISVRAVRNDDDRLAYRAFLNQTIHHRLETHTLVPVLGPLLNLTSVAV